MHPVSLALAVEIVITVAIIVGVAIAINGHAIIAALQAWAVQ